MGSTAKKTTGVGGMGVDPTEYENATWNAE